MPTGKNRNPLKEKAGHAVRDAIARGDLKRGLCEVCGTTVRVQAHHSDYTRPMLVHWLCLTHHAIVHSKLKRHFNNDYSRTRNVIALMTFKAPTFEVYDELLTKGN